MGEKRDSEIERMRIWEVEDHVALCNKWERHIPVYM